MLVTITDVVACDIRFPTFLRLAGSKREGLRLVHARGPMTHPCGSPFPTTRALPSHPLQRLGQRRASHASRPLSRNKLAGGEAPLRRRGAPLGPPDPHPVAVAPSGVRDGARPVAKAAEEVGLLLVLALLTQPDSCLHHARKPLPLQSKHITCESRARKPRCRSLRGLWTPAQRTAAST